MLQHTKFIGPIILLAVGLTGCGDGSSGGGSGVTSAGAPTVKVLSNRADLISGGDALVEVEWPAGVSPAAARVEAAGRNVTGAFARRANGRYIGLVSGLAPGRNVLSARLADGPAGNLAIVNHPNGGPVFSGPQIQPWVCQDTAVDEQCNQPAEYSLLYKSTDPSKPGLQPYNPDSPPSDVATATTDEGVTLPFIVRLERGYQDRDEYKILMLFQPDQPWEPWSPQEQWNHKLLVTHGGSCGTDRGTGSAPLDDYSGTLPVNPLENSYVIALGRGFGVMSTALDNSGHNCNVIVMAESLMMAKERLVEQYGELRYTIGTGCSGGSLAQAMVANAYPGIYQGLLTTCSYPDVGSTAVQFADFHLLRLYFEDPSKWGSGVIWLPTQWADVEGHIAAVNAIAADEAFFKAVSSPIGSCAGADSYHPQSNPGGVRCGLLDYLINMLGPRPEPVWSDMEKAAQRGFAGNPLDNVGVQYGLNALREGKITPAQFVDLNTKVGGLDIDFLPQAQRSVADEFALARFYRSGEVNETNNLDRVAIINFTGPDPGLAHDAVHAWWTRWRLDREHGHHDNHVMWGGPVPIVGDPFYAQQSLLAMDRWLGEIEQDTSTTPLAQKIVQHKPADTHDQCSDGLGHKLLDTPCPDQLGMVFGTPRTVAGADKTADNGKCVLRPPSRDDDYGPIGLSDEQWTQMQTIFPTGVCDYSQPGIGQQPGIEWLSYGDAVQVIYGGKPLAPAPTGVAPGWSSAAFSSAP